MSDLKKPKLVRDWAGGYVRFDRPIRNGYGEMPAYTVFKVTGAAITAHFESLGCDCCGFKFRFTSKGRDKFDGAEWLGYEPPEFCKECRALLPDGCKGMLKSEQNCEREVAQ